MGRGEEMKPQVLPDHYFESTYDSKERFVSYWCQIKEITDTKPKSILEVGIGNGFVSSYLKQRKINITTLDIDNLLYPEVVGSVANIPFHDESFEIVTCFEVLEHIPYKNLSKALREIHRVSNRYAILSLPDCTKVYRVSLQIPKIGLFQRLIPIPQLRPPTHKFDGEHHWEIGKAGFPLQNVMSEMKNAGFEIKKTYRVFEVPYHRFFVLEKR